MFVHAATGLKPSLSVVIEATLVAIIVGFFLLRLRRLFADPHLLAYDHLLGFTIASYESELLALPMIGYGLTLNLIAVELSDVAFSYSASTLFLVSLVQSLCCVQVALLARPLLSKEVAEKSAKYAEVARRRLDSEISRDIERLFSTCSHPDRHKVTSLVSARIRTGPLTPLDPAAIRHIQNTTNDRTRVRVFVVGMFPIAAVLGAIIVENHLLPLLQQVFNRLVGEA